MYKKHSYFPKFSNLRCSLINIRIVLIWNVTINDVSYSVINLPLTIFTLFFRYRTINIYPPHSTSNLLKDKIVIVQGAKKVIKKYPKNRPKMFLQNVFTIPQSVPGSLSRHDYWCRNDRFWRSVAIDKEFLWTRPRTIFRRLPVCALFFGGGGLFGMGFNNNNID